MAVTADGADFRGLRADDEVAADAAFPHAFAGLFEDLLHLNVLEELEVAFLVGAFDGADGAELGGEFGKAFLFGVLGELDVHVGPFVVFAFSGGLEVGGRGLDAAEGGVNDVLADLFGIRQRTAFADGCGRVGDIDPITVPELAALAQHKLAALCNAPDTGTAVQVKFADTGKPVRRLAVISGAGGSLFAEAIAEGADCLLTGEANHHHALDAKRLGLSLIAAGHYATEFPVTAAVAAALRAALPEVEVLVSTENRDPYTYL